MSEAERRVLMALVDCRLEHGDYSIMPFDPIIKRTGLDRATVRRCCRSLKRKGYAEFVSGLCDEGEFRGAGYGATVKGMNEGIEA